MVYSLIHKWPPPVPILSQINPVHVSPAHFLKIYFVIILSPTPGSSKWSFLIRSLHQIPACTSPLPHTCPPLRPFRSSLFVRPNNIVSKYIGVKIQDVSFTGALITAALSYGKPALGRLSADSVVFRTAMIETFCGRPKNQACTHSLNYVALPIYTVEMNIRIAINTGSGVNVFISTWFFFTAFFISVSVACYDFCSGYFSSWNFLNLQKKF